uniref:Uncharacterized protein n=1 Tax=Tanacetum cinerariifolium TaxID=118510 RepID=A0A699VZJ9_TANCI|nr:hypothetical protein [Tanacetum cinerariifolium]
MGGIEDRAVFQLAGVLGSDQRAFDDFLTVTGADVCDQQFVAHGAFSNKATKAAFSQESVSGASALMFASIVDRRDSLQLAALHLCAAQTRHLLSRGSSSLSFSPYFPNQRGATE